MDGWVGGWEGGGSEERRWIGGWVRGREVDRWVGKREGGGWVRGGRWEGGRLG